MTMSLSSVVRRGNLGTSLETVDLKDLLLATAVRCLSRPGPCALLFVLRAGEEPREGVRGVLSWAMLGRLGTDALSILDRR